MSYQVLARKYRPQKFSDVIGQEHVTRTLMNAISQARIAHGYIFSGHRGIGKTTVARILAMALNCKAGSGPQAEPCGVCDSCREIREGAVGAMNVIEIDAATNRGIDEVRSIIATSEGQPARGDRYRIFILDEAHQITEAAFNALLKTLEEPPPWVVFMMATTQPEDIPQTIRSRCQHFSFHAVKFADIVTQLRDIARQEKIKLDDDAVAVLAEAGDGSMRDALSIMDQAIACCGATLTAELVRSLVGAVPAETLERVMDAVERSAADDALRLVDQLVTEGQSPTHFARQLVRFLRNALVAKVSSSDSPLLQISAGERARVARIAGKFSEEDLARFLAIMLRTHDELGYRQEQRFHLELGILKMVHAQRLLPLEQLLSNAPLPARSPSQPERSAGVPPAVPRASSPAAKTPEPPRVSPFERDRARKTEQSSVGVSPAATATAVVLAEPPPEPAADLSPDSLCERVVAALESAGQRTLAYMLADGEWKLSGAEVLINVPKSPAVVDMALGPEPKRLLTTALNEAAGRALRFKVVGVGAAANGGNGNGASANPQAAAPRGRVADEPVVRRMQEKFNAEIRSVIDHKNKKP
ncbi:MAG: DNA polymerase III subunit gamma/tau [Candidatus Koribacter versatilis]|uniref:DNA polymerase III subunit gamma/tau n=1 Tax=Candidatus Korobacter versatilis TaxID=658062 RepID=A0A932EQE7_9BACT|nr:DNA polymerase III subunit gamma/tau [Candidatus Koribacter versatilis]